MCLLISPAFAQQSYSTLTYSHSLSTSSASTISQDRDGNIYMLDAKRTLRKYDPSGKPLLHFSPTTRGQIAAIEAWNPLKVLLFYEDRQEILLLDRFLRPITSTQLSDYNISGTVRAATQSSDDSFWLFNETELTLSKLDIRNRSVTVSTPLNLILDQANLDVRQLREYQNKVYMLDANGGVLVFDNLGNYTTKLPFTGLSYISFYGNELYFVKDNILYFYDLYQQKQRTIALPSSKVYQAAFVSNKYTYLFSQKELDVYNLQP
ncbi:hypothetical protein C1N53_20280 [Pontibacter sp. SGAir0037]|nr:hypothetical protein C1N53_20280 [Pontibacter sp. SGAir0037]